MAVLTFIIRRGSLLFPSGIHPEKHSHNHSVLILKNASEDFATRLTNLSLSFPQVRPSCFYFQKREKKVSSAHRHKNDLWDHHNIFSAHIHQYSWDYGYGYWNKGALSRDFWGLLIFAHCPRVTQWWVELQMFAKMGTKKFPSFFP